jgi:hypothetical protein
MKFLLGLFSSGKRGEKFFARTGNIIFALFFVAVFLFPPVKAQTAVSDSGSFYTTSVGTASFTASGYLKNTDTIYTRSFSYPAQYDSNHTFYMKASGDSIKLKIVLQEYAAGTWSTLKTINDSLEVSTLYSKDENFSEIARQYRYVIIGLPENAPEGSPINGYHTAWALEDRFKRWPY